MKTDPPATFVTNWLRIPLVLIACSCCCFPGKEARPIVWECEWTKNCTCTCNINSCWNEDSHHDCIYDDFVSQPKVSACIACYCGLGEHVIAPVSCVRSTVRHRNCCCRLETGGNRTHIEIGEETAAEMPHSEGATTGFVPAESSPHSNRSRRSEPERALILRPSGRTLPISPRENETLSPAAGVIIYDLADNAPAHRNYLSRYTWEGSIGLLYPEGVYPGRLVGNTTRRLEGGANEMLFEDVIISHWGYSYILNVTLRALQTPRYDHLACTIGPFDVDVLETFEMPLVDSSEFRNVRIVFDGEFRRVREDERRFRIFFLNLFGRRYPTVRWHNVTTSEGSVVVDAVITGVSGELDRTAQSLAKDIGNGRADIRYDGNRPWRASSVFMPTRKLLEEGEGSEAKEEAGLSVAWIVAIVINVVLIVVFVIAIVYCYCRRKKQRELARTGTAIRGGPEPLLFATKAATEGKGPFQTVFSVEDERNKREDGRRTCTCYSPRCYCSVGDGRRTETTGRYVEENEDDPQGYPSPSPEPTFPTPLPPTPPQPVSPDPSDFWRPETQQEEDPDDMFLPGAISDPEPEPARDVRYLVYRVDDGAGSRELMGQVSLPEDAFLGEARRAIDRDLRPGEDYRFLDQNLDTVLHYQESSLDLERICSHQEIHIRFAEQPKPKTPSPVLQKVRIPAYVGPLGVCTASECPRAAKIKCLDCRNVAYCSKRCMKEDAKDHRKNCYKPAWRL